MPRVERYTQRQVATRPLPTVRRQAAETYASAGGLQAEAIAGFGAAATRVGLEIHEAERQQADTVALTTAERQLGEIEHQLTTDPEHGFETVKGQAVLGLRSKSMELFDQQADMIASNLTSDRQRQAFTRAREQRRFSVLEGIERHTSRELAAYDKGEATAGITTAANLAIANAETPRRVAEELGRIDGLVDTYAGVLGVSGPEAKKEFLADVRSKVHVGVVERLISLDRDVDAADYFAEVKDQITGSALGALETKLDLASTEGIALRASNEIWDAHGPDDDVAPIALDTMEAAARARFADNPKALKATIDWLRQRKIGVDAGRKEREEATLNTVWGAVMEGRPMTAIQRAPAFVSAPARVQIQVRDYYQRQLEHQASLAYQAEARANAAESRAWTREQRQERQLEMRTWSTYATLADPQQLRHMTRGQILEQLPKLGRDNTNRLLNDHEQLLKSDAAVRDATIDADLFTEIAYDAGLDYVTKTPGQRSEAENANVGRLRSTVEDAIASAQGRKGGQLTREEKRATMEQIIDGRVRVADWFFDSDSVGAVVPPESRGAAYVPIAQIDSTPKTYGTAYTQALNYLRGLPGQARASDADLRRQFRGRIEKAVGRSFSGASRQEIESALKGLD